VLTTDDYQLPQNARDNIINVLDEEIHLLRLAEKKPSNISRDEDEDDDEETADVVDLSPETRGAIHERRICDLAARMVLAILGGSLPKTFADILGKYKSKVGQSYEKIILELGMEKPVVKKVKAVPAAVVEDAEDPIEDIVVEEIIVVGSEMDVDDV
jgi:hypothetical protein